MRLDYFEIAVKACAQLVALAAGVSVLYRNESSHYDPMRRRHRLTRAGWLQLGGLAATSVILFVAGELASFQDKRQTRDQASAQMALLEEQLAESKKLGAQQQALIDSQGETARQQTVIFDEQHKQVEVLQDAAARTRSLDIGRSALAGIKLTYSARFSDSSTSFLWNAAVRSLQRAVDKAPAASTTDGSTSAASTMAAWRDKCYRPAQRVGEACAVFMMHGSTGAGVFDADALADDLTVDTTTADGEPSSVPDLAAPYLTVRSDSRLLLDASAPPLWLIYMATVDDSGKRQLEVSIRFRDTTIRYDELELPLEIEGSAGTWTFESDDPGVAFTTSTALLASGKRQSSPWPSATLHLHPRFSSDTRRLRAAQQRSRPQPLVDRPSLSRPAP